VGRRRLRTAPARAALRSLALYALVAVAAPARAFGIELLAAGRGVPLQSFPGIGSQPTSAGSRGTGLPGYAPPHIDEQWSFAQPQFCAAVISRWCARARRDAQRLAALACVAVAAGALARRSR
jgi:hypothetical protein